MFSVGVLMYAYCYREANIDNKLYQGWLASFLPFVFGSAFRPGLPSHPILLPSHEQTLYNAATIIFSSLDSYFFFISVPHCMSRQCQPSLSQYTWGQGNLFSFTLLLDFAC